jgi:hypothetical protein
MTLSRIAQKRDANEPKIVDVLEALGCSVDRLPGGDGRMDLLVGDNWCGYRYDFKVEVKMPGEQLNPKQRQYHADWVGAPIHVVWTEADIIAVLKHYRERAPLLAKFLKSVS